MGTPRVDDLFRVHGEAVVGGRTLYLRTMTVKENQDRVNYALDCAGAMRRALLQEGSAEWERVVKPLREMSKEDLITLCADRQRVLLTLRSLREVTPPISPEPPENASLADIVKAHEEDERVQKDTESQRAAWVEGELEAYRAHLQKKKREAILEEATEAAISQAVEAEWAAASDRYTLYASCFTDPARRERLFRSPEEVGEIAHRAFQELLTAYQNLDLYLTNPEALKNSP